MKKLFLAIIGLAALLGIGCSDSGSAGNARVMELYSLAAMTAQTGQVSFTYNQQSSSQQSRSMALYSIGGPANAPAASAVVVTIQNAAGATVYNARSLPLVDMNGSYITQPIDLVVGQYRLTQFIVVDSEGHALYATPVEGSPLAGFNLVDDPLPINFTVALNQTSKLIPQVLSVEEYTPDQFGYETLSFDIVDVINFQAGVMVYNAGSGNYELTGAAITISTGGTQLYSGSLQAATNSLAVKDGYASYDIRVAKTGYADYTRTLTAGELKEFEAAPLVIELLPVGQQGSGEIPLVVSAQIYNEGSSHEPTTAAIYCTFGGETHNAILHPVPTVVEGIADGYDSYDIRVSKAGYDDFTQTLTNAQIKSYTTEPLVVLLHATTPQTALQWAWMSGDSAANQYGVYGTKGMRDAANKPGSRYGGVTWTDSSGNLWLFGGLMSTGSNTLFFNDLWRYEPSTGIWTWMSGDNAPNQTGVFGTKGIGDAANKPGSRYGSAAWIDSSGNLWLFGGQDAGGFSLNDLWKYEPSTGMWTWMFGGDNAYHGTYGTKGVAGAANIPGARHGSVTWTDSSGSLWLFGGVEYDGYVNDLWKYEPSTGMWTWISGDNSVNQFGVYGTKRTGNSANKPGARSGSVSWIDSSGNLWLFGGEGYALSAYGGNLNDLWRYEPSTGMWTWMSGDNNTTMPAVYGSKGMRDTANKPGARKNSVSWIDSSGNLWLFGGNGVGNGTSSGSGTFNDLWRYEPSNGMWTWMSGNNSDDDTGVYGTKGVANAANKPGSRQDCMAWADSTGNLWLFGGISAGQSFLYIFNDLWRVHP